MTKSKYSDGCAWIGGQYVPIGEAAIPITDTGFTRSDVTYDVVSVWNGQFFRLEDHVDRFERSWKKMRLSLPLTRTEMTRILHTCVARTGLREAYVEMILTRGMPVNGDRDPRNFLNRFYAFAIPYVWIANPELQTRGINLVIANDACRIGTDSVDPKVKNFHWGDLTRGLFEAFDRDADSAILLDVNGNVTEGPGFNIFAYRDGRLLTPSSGVLEGITRATIIDLAKELGLECVVANVDAATLRDAEEIFLTTTAGGVIPVRALDGTPLGSGLPGPLTLEVKQRYWDAHDRQQWATPVLYTSQAVGSVA